MSQAREPAFYERYGFADTVTGRFDCLALHLFLLSRRLVRADTQPARSLNQEVFDRFIDDIDRALRELGVGDTSVPKRKKKLVRGFYGMVADFSAPMDGNDRTALLRAVANRFECGEPAAELLADYVLSAARHLDWIDGERLLSGTIDWPQAGLATGAAA
ncbi:MAG: ubiquinol-cytochrome C chaperone [Nitratireductor sp.]|nr:ubiquinol-cytochrome C chaperone [Nitratireductor sp.]